MKINRYLPSYYYLWNDIYIITCFFSVKKKKATSATPVTTPKEKIWVPKYPWIRMSGKTISCHWCNLKLDIKSIKDYAAHEFSKKHFETSDIRKESH